MYWQSWAKGEELFSSDSTMLGQIRSALNKNGGEIVSWDLEAHRNQLLAWKGVHNFKDALTWIFPAKISHDSSKWVFWSLGPVLKTFDFSRVPKEKLVLFLWEPPTVEPEGYNPAWQKHFGKIYTWDDDLVDGVKFFKFHYPELQNRIAHLTPFSDKKLCVMVARRLSSKHPKQLYSEREKVIRYFEDKPDLFDLYGYHWEKRKYRNWKGTVQNKIETIKNYKFAICYENMGNVRGYVTEKLFDCFAAGTIPVYLGASNVTDYIPADCFIDRRKFNSEQELCTFLQSMSEAEYQGYLDRTALFLQSEKAQLFSVKNFVATFLTIH